MPLYSLGCKVFCAVNTCSTLTFDVQDKTPMCIRIQMMDGRIELLCYSLFLIYTGNTCYVLFNCVVGLIFSTAIITSISLNFPVGDLHLSNLACTGLLLSVLPPKYLHSISMFPFQTVALFVTKFLFTKPCLFTRPFFFPG